MKKGLVISALMFMAGMVSAKTYYVSPVMGNDSNKGTSAVAPFKTLDRIAEIGLMPGDSVLLHTEGVHKGVLKLIDVCGGNDSPVYVSAYDTVKGRRRLARIDAAESVAGVYMENCKHIEVSRLMITANGGAADELARKEKMRSGVLVKVSKEGSYGDISLEQLHIKDVYYNQAGFKRGKAEVRTSNGTQTYGWGIRFINPMDNAVLENISVCHSTIEDVAHTGIKITGKKRNIRNFVLAYNDVVRSGGPGIQISGGEKGHVHNNEVAYSGSEDDTRKWGRGSGLWTWGTKDVLIEKNRFMYSNGPGDSAGAHIDFNCGNIIMQYNLSAYNAGGFCEILGNNYNCVYRYNISVNDGFRRKGQGGAFQEGKTLWTSGYVGKKQKPKGPFNSYIYNNTIYASDDIKSQMAIGNTTNKLWIANNIIYMKGGIKSVLGDQYRAEKKGESQAKGVMVCNNLFVDVEDWNKAVEFASKNSFSGNPDFKNEGGMCPKDYIPMNNAAVKDRGVEIPLTGGIEPLGRDFLGNPVVGKPDLGAIECEND